MTTEMSSQYPSPMLCRCFDVSISGSYRSLATPVSQWEKDEKRLEIENKWLRTPSAEFDCPWS
jgi:hypothetical protein